MLAINSYYTNIPGDIMGDPKINVSSKLLFGIIKSLCHKEGFCWASNKYLAKLVNVSVSSIKRWKNILVKFGYIKSEIIYKEGTKEVACRKIFLTDLAMTKTNLNRGVGSKRATNNIKENNIDYIIRKKERNLRTRMNNSTNDESNYTDDEINKIIEEHKSKIKYLENLKNINQDNQNLETIEENEQLKEEYHNDAQTLNCQNVEGNNALEFENTKPEETHTYQDAAPRIKKAFQKIFGSVKKERQESEQLKEEYPNCIQNQAKKESEAIHTPDIISKHSDIFDTELKNKYYCEGIGMDQQDNYTESKHTYSLSMKLYGRESFDEITARKISNAEERVKLGEYLAFYIRKIGKINNSVWKAFLDRYLSLGNTVKERLANLAYSLAGGYHNIFKAPKNEQTQSQTQYSAISIFE